MKILSLFDWMACWYEALVRAWIKIDKYYASEIDKYAIQIATKNHPDIIEIWDVCKVTYSTPDYDDCWEYLIADWEIIDKWPIDLLIWGSPCQWFSLAWKQLAFNDPRSKLFFEYVRLLKECKPKYFLLENVKMKKEYVDIISQMLWVQPIEINSSLVSAQNRKRLYWTNIPWVTQPKDKWILLKDILDKNVDEKYYLTERQIEMIRNWKWFEKPLDRVKWFNDKSDTLTTHCWKFSNWIKLVNDGKWIRRFTPNECDALQTLNKWYSEWVWDTQRWVMLGNWWTVDVIAHIFRFIKE